MKLDTVVKELRKDNWLTGITFIEENRDFLQALVDETEKQLILSGVSHQRKLLLQAYKDGFDSATESLLAANKIVQDRKLQ
jgi:hypothetical protein